MRCSTTASLRASATFARFIPRFLAMRNAQAFNVENRVIRVRMTFAASNKAVRHHHVADFGDPARPVDLAGLILTRRQTKIRPEIPGFVKPRRIVDGRPVRHRNDRADAGRRHKSPTDRVGAVVAVTYRNAVDDPTRFRKSKDLGPYFGITPSKYQSGEVDRTGRITKVGDVMVRTALFEAAHVILTRVTRFSTLKAWALRIAKQRGFKRAKVALARKLAVVLHRMWVDGTDFRWRKAAA